MIKAVPYKDLKVHADIQTPNQRLEYFERVGELMRQDRAKCNPLILWAWEEEHRAVYMRAMGEVGKARTELKIDESVMKDEDRININQAKMNCRNSKYWDVKILWP